MLEQVMKARLVDWLISTNKNQLICSELIFFEGKRRADIVTVGDDLSVYEIKGDYDNLTKVIDQVKDYQLCFDYVFIVTTAKHFSKLYKILPKAIGIIYIQESGETEIKRNAQKRKRLDKELLCSFLPRALVYSNIKNKNPKIKLTSKISVTDLRRVLAKALRVREIRSLVLEHLRLKHSQNFRLFLNERGKVTHPDDLLLLTSKPDEIMDKYQ